MKKLFVIVVVMVFTLIFSSFAYSQKTNDEKPKVSFKKLQLGEPVKSESDLVEVMKIQNDKKTDNDQQITETDKKTKKNNKKVNKKSKECCAQKTQCGNSNQKCCKQQENKSCCKHKNMTKNKSQKK